MVKKILYATAVDEHGQMVHIDDSQKGKSYYCLGCNEKLVLRKSGKSGAGSRRPHFAHNGSTHNCSPETVLHMSFKKMLVELINKNMAEQNKIPISWKCGDCGREYTGDLLEKAVVVKEEYSLGSCRPDIVLLDKNEEVIVAIEIVVTHPPEESTLQYYRDNKIVLIQINLSTEDELRKVLARIRKPDLVVYCMNRMCANCVRYEIGRSLRKEVIPCELCMRAPIERYSVVLDGRFGQIETRDFTDSEIDSIRSVRYNIMISTDRETGGKYPRYICPVCGLKPLRRF